MPFSLLPSFRPEDRVLVTGLLAIALHALIILCVNFTAEITIVRPPRLEITLANTPTDRRIEAEFIAQVNQQGSGNQSPESAITTDKLAPLPDDMPREASQVPPELNSASPKPVEERSVVTTVTKTVNPFANDKKPLKEKNRFDKLEDKIQYLERRIEITNLEAQLDNLKKEYSRIPKVYRMTSLSTRSEEDAEYLFHWQKRIEQVGNRHYPGEALKKNLVGDVRLLVAIRADGGVHEVKILQSSGHRTLDNAALATIKMASPFPPLPPAIRQKGEILEIIRTWQFKNSLKTSAR